MTRSRQFCVYFNPRYLSPLRARGRARLMSPITRDLCWNFHSYTDPTLPILHARARVCVLVRWCMRHQGE